MSEKNNSQTNKKNPINKRRKRFLLERKLDTLNIIVITVIFVVGFLYLLVFPRDTISNEENRVLSTFPKFTVSSFFSGEYTEAIATYYDDTVPNRSFFKKISANILKLKGREYGDDGLVIYGGIQGGNDEEPETTTIPETTTSTSFTEKSPSSNTSTTETTTTVTTTTEPSNQNPNAEGQIANNIVVVNNRGLNLFGGSKSNGEQYASYLNAYKQDLGENVNVYSMVCPTAVSYYMPDNYLDLTASEEDNITHINEFLIDVTPIDVFTALLYHKNEDIYARTDHHWKQLGAYYAAEEFAKVAEVPFNDISDYEKVSLPNYVGTLYGYTQSSALINNPEDFVYYTPPEDYTTTYYTPSFEYNYEGRLLMDPTNMSESNYYLIFMGGDEKIVHINTSVKNGRNLVIFKDSYGNALTPNLTGSFENIYVCDLRYFELNSIEFIKSVEGTDVLFAMNTFSATGSNYKLIETIRTQ